MDSQVFGSRSFSLFWNHSDCQWGYGGSDNFINVIDFSINDVETKDGNFDTILSTIATSCDEKFAAFGTEGEVILRRFPNINEPGQNLCRTTLAVRDLKFTHNSRFLIVASEDPDVNIFSVDDSEKVETIATNSIGVRAVAISPTDANLAIMDMDGNLAMYAMSPISMKRDHLCSIHKGLISKDIARDADNVGFEMAWIKLSGNGEALFVPGKSGAINVLTRSNAVDAWKESPLMGDPTSPLSHSSNDVNIVNLSPNGAFLASCDKSGHIVVWKIDYSDPSKSTPIRSFAQAEGNIMDLKWGVLPTNNYLVVLQSKFLQINDVVPADVGHPAVPTETARETTTDTLLDSDYIRDEDLMAAFDNVEAANAIDAEAKAAKAAMDVDGDEEFKETSVKDKRKRLQKATVTTDNDDDDEFLMDDAPTAATAASATAVTDNAASTFKKNAPLFSADEAPKKVKDMFNEEAKVSGKEMLKEALQEEEDDDLDDFDDDNLDDDSGIVDKVGTQKKFSGDIMEIAKALEQSGALAAAVAKKLQPAFQPACTRPDEKSRRYLVWNSVGNITLREEALENRIEIRFTDASRGNRNEAFPDRNGFVMGALGYHGAAFATPAEEPPRDELYRDPLLDVENPNPLKNYKGSTLFYHAFPGPQHLEGVNENFKIVLQEGEEVEALAVGAGFVAAATSKKWLRIYSSTGLEISVMALPGPVVCMVALNDTLAVIFHAGLPFDESFNMAMHLFRINWRQGYAISSILHNFSVPLSRKANLEWIGFDADNISVVILDSHGIMSTLMHTAGYQWTPVLNIIHIRKTIDHRYWPIMVKNGKLVYVLLNGESKPAIYPQPVVSTKSLRIAIATHRDGTDFNEAMKEKMHGLLWEKMKVDNLEHEVSMVAGKPELMEELQSLETALEAQQVASDRLVLASFQEACATQQIPLALSLGIRLKMSKSLMAGIKIANHFGRVAVAEALDGMLQHRQALEMYQQQLQMAATGAGTMMMAEEEQHANHQPYSHTDPADYDAFHESAENDNYGGGVLSRKASLKQQTRPTVPSSATTEHTKKIVSPDANHSDTRKTETATKALNPFAVNKTGQTPQKRTASVLENLESPSPKKPVLNRQSTFSQNARKHHLNNKQIL